jgi:glycine oxidase
MHESRDAIVIGGGIVGCAVAYELASRGIPVTIVDARGVGRGATHASAGILSPYIEGHDHGALLDLGVESLRLYEDFVARAVADSGRPVFFSRSGTLEVALAEDSVELLRSSAVALQGRGVTCELLDARAAREAEPLLTAGVQAALLVPEHAFVAAPQLVTALADAARAKGARFVSAAVGRVRAIDGALSVETDDGVLRARSVVLAAGSWSGTIELEGVPALPVRPVRGQLLRLGWTGERLRHATWGARCYLVPWSDGTLLVGATVEETGFDERTTVAGVRDLLEAACELVPGAWKAGFLDARAGLRPASPDGLPIVGASMTLPGLIYATAHYRTGVLLAPLTARLVTSLVLGERADPALDGLAPGRLGGY